MILCITNKNIYIYKDYYSFLLYTLAKYLLKSYQFSKVYAGDYKRQDDFSSLSMKPILLELSHQHFSGGLCFENWLEV